MAIHNPVTSYGVNSSGDSEAQLVTGGAAYTRSPGDVSGNIRESSYLISDTAGTPDKTTLSFPSGLKGLRVQYNRNSSMLNPATALVANQELHIAFNNTVFSDEDTAGMYRVIPVGGDEIFEFDIEPLPTSVVIVAAAADTSAGDTQVIWTAAEV